MTGYGQESDIVKSRGAGFDAHLVKPVDVEEIIRLADVSARSAKAKAR